MNPALAAVRSELREELRRAGVPSPEVDAEALVAAVLEVEPAELVGVRALTAQQMAEVRRLASRRVAREPLQHIIGGTGFRYLWLAVGPGVFVPRPETETLVQVVLDYLAEHVEGPRQSAAAVPIVVDMCAGSGAVGLAVATEFPGVRVIAVEKEPAAVEWLLLNAKGCAETIRKGGSQFEVVHGDVLADPLAGLAGRVSAVVANPPYIPTGAVPRDPEVRDHDPAVALYGGEDGMSIIRPLIEIAAGLLVPGGLLAIEHGDEQGENARDGDGVPSLIRAAGNYERVEDISDLSGRPRVSVARRRTG